MFEKNIFSTNIFGFPQKFGNFSWNLYWRSPIEIPAKISEFLGKSKNVCWKNIFFEHFVFFSKSNLSQVIPQKFSWRWCNLTGTGPGFTAKTLDFAPKLSFFAEGFICERYISIHCQKKKNPDQKILFFHGEIRFSKFEIEQNFLKFAK